jgi:rod shape-determining protein MreD
MAAAHRGWWMSILSLVATLALASVPLPDAVAPFRPDWVAVVLLYWSLMAPRHFSLLTAFWMGIALDTLTGALLGQNALALLVIVYLAEKFHLRLRVFPLSQLAFTVLLLLGLYEFILFWIDGMAPAFPPGTRIDDPDPGRTVPLVQRWLPPLTGTLVWVALYMMFDRREREAPARL